jgi:hypothetical protein
MQVLPLDERRCEIGAQEIRRSGIHLLVGAAGRRRRPSFV